jgi:hypothetical protein
MTPLERLNQINDLLSGDTGNMADCMVGGLHRDATENEKELSELLMAIYELAHPASGCKYCHDKDCDETPSYNVFVGEYEYPVRTSGSRKVRYVKK